MHIIAKKSRDCIYGNRVNHLFSQMPKETKDNGKPEVQSEAAEEPATKTETGTPEKEEENA